MRPADITRKGGHSWHSSRNIYLFRLDLCRGCVAPEPAHRVGKDGSTVVGGVAAVAKNGLVVVFLEFERRFHFLIGNVPVAELVDEIIAAVLQEDADVLLGRGTNDVRITVSPFDVGVAAEV